MKIIETKKELDIVWLRAAILGSIWASSEIILGSFLHNLKLPFSGTFLSAIAVYLLVSFDLRWKTSGVIWRAGIICALMKSISPSAVIFGPMVAIAMEGLIVEGMLKLFRRNIAGYLIAGAIGVTWSLIHKAINLLIFYGPDIFTIYKNMYKYAVKVTGINPGSTYNAVIILFAVYLFIGSMAALLGYLTKRVSNTEKFSFDKEIPEDISIFRNMRSFTDHSLIWLLFEVLVLTAGLYLLSLLDIYWGFIFVTSITFINFIRYREFIFRSFKLKFWISLVLVAASAGFFIGGINENGWVFSLENLIAGFQIALRVILLTQCFRIIGIELTNKKIKDFFTSINFGMLPAALETAFNSLPMMITVLNSNRENFNKPSLVVSGFIKLADEHILQIVEERKRSLQPIRID